MKLKNSKLLPLLVLYASEETPVVGITRFQKLVYIAQKRIENIDEYEFEPYSYGPFSRELYDDIDELVGLGYIDYEEEETSNGNERKVYELSDKGRELIEKGGKGDRLWYNTLLNDIADVKEDYNQMPLLKMLKRIYSEDPEMAERSELNLLF